MQAAVEQAVREIASSSKEYSRPGTGPRRVVVMSGLPYSGKSYLSNRIIERASKAIALVRSDAIRPIVVRHMGYDSPRYAPEEHAAVFEAGRQLVRMALEMEVPAIADATNLTDRYREWAVSAAREAKGESLVAFVQASVGLAIDRAMAKGDRSGSAATSKVYTMLNREREPIEDCTTPYVIVDSSRDITECAKALSDWLCGYKMNVPGTIAPQKK